MNGIWVVVSLIATAALGADSAPTARAIRAEVIINRKDAAWESQQVQEPCILPNPKDPMRLVMFYSGVPASNRNLCCVGKAWALKSDPFAWHQVSKRGGTYVLTMEVGTEKGKRWRPVVAVSQRPDKGWAQLDVDTVLQTKWEGCYRDEAIFVRNDRARETTISPGRQPERPTMRILKSECPDGRPVTAVVTRGSQGAGKATRRRWALRQSIRGPVHSLGPCWAHNGEQRFLGISRRAAKTQRP